MPALTVRPRHLVDDEILTLRIYGHAQRFRLRIWRATNEPALVLVDHVPGSISPHLVSERIANLIKAAYLAHTARGMFYFERSDTGQLYSASFTTLGHGERFRLVKPQHVRLDRDFLDEYLGDTLES